MKETRKIERALQLGSFLVLIAAIVVKAAIGYNNKDVFITLAFVGLLVWVVLSVCAYIPVEWNMTLEQRKKIKDKSAYQNKFRMIMKIVVMASAVFMGLLILFVA